MKIVSIAEIKADLETYLKQNPQEAIVMTENDRPIAAVHFIVDPEERDRFLLARSAQFNDIIAASRQSIREEGGLDSDSFWNAVDRLPEIP